jgi:hypothetical protein
MTELITKISLVNDTTTQIGLNDAEAKTKNDDPNIQRKRETKEVVMAYRHPDFNAAMAALLPHVLKVFELPETWVHSTTLKHATLHRSDRDGFGATFTIVKTYEHIGGALPINTLQLHEDLNESGKSKLPDDMRQALYKLMDEAQAFRSGKQAQGQLFAETDLEEEDEDETQANLWAKNLTVNIESGEEESEQDNLPAFKDEAEEKHTRKKRRVVHIK